MSDREGDNEGEEGGTSSEGEEDRNDVEDNQSVTNSTSTDRKSRG